MDEKIKQLKDDVTNLEEYTPIINERLANNELAIQRVEERLEASLNKPSADLSELEQSIKKIQIGLENLQNSQLGVNRVKILVDEA